MAEAGARPKHSSERSDRPQLPPLNILNDTSNNVMPRLAHAGTEEDYIKEATELCIVRDELRKLLYALLRNMKQAISDNTPGTVNEYYRECIPLRTDLTETMNRLEEIWVEADLQNWNVISILNVGQISFQEDVLKVRLLIKDIKNEYEAFRQAEGESKDKTVINSLYETIESEKERMFIVLQYMCNCTNWDEALDKVKSMVYKDEMAISFKMFVNGAANHAKMIQNLRLYPKATRTNLFKKTLEEGKLYDEIIANILVKIDDYNMSNAMNSLVTNSTPTRSPGPPYFFPNSLHKNQINGETHIITPAASIDDGWGKANPTTAAVSVNHTGTAPSRDEGNAMKAGDTKG